MIRSLPSITTTVSSEWEIGRKYGYRPTACSSRALVKLLHLSNNATCCRVSVFNGAPGLGWETAVYRLVAVTQNPPGTRPGTPAHLLPGRPNFEAGPFPPEAPSSPGGAPPRCPPPPPP